MERMSLENGRKLFHLTLGIFITALLYFDIIDVWIILPITLAGFLVSAIKRRKRMPITEWFLRRFEREENIATMPGKGALYFFVGLLLVLALFPKDVALASVIIFSIGDSIATMVGMRVGRIKHPLSSTKFLEGSAAGFVWALLGALLFVPPLEALAASFFAMAVEGIDFIKGRRVEDNITVPLVAGVTIMIMRMLL